jgi:disulfide oxidoreductase YuzD
MESCHGSTLSTSLVHEMKMKDYKVQTLQFSCNFPLSKPIEKWHNVLAAKKLATEEYNYRVVSEFDLNKDNVLNGKDKNI